MSYPLCYYSGPKPETFKLQGKNLEKIWGGWWEVRRMDRVGSFMLPHACSMTKLYQCHLGLNQRTKYLLPSGTTSGDWVCVFYLLLNTMSRSSEISRMSRTHCCSAVLLKLNCAGAEGLHLIPNITGSNPKAQTWEEP